MTDDSRSGEDAPAPERTARTRSRASSRPTPQDRVNAVQGDGLRGRRAAVAAENASPAGHVGCGTRRPGDATRTGYVFSKARFHERMHSQVEPVPPESRC